MYDTNPVYIMWNSKTWTCFFVIIKFKGKHSFIHVKIKSITISKNFVVKSLLFYHDANCICTYICSQIPNSYFKCSCPKFSIKVQFKINVMFT